MIGQTPSGLPRSDALFPECTCLSDRKGLLFRPQISLAPPASQPRRSSPPSDLPKPRRGVPRGTPQPSPRIALPSRLLPMLAVGSSADSAPAVDWQMQIGCPQDAAAGPASWHNRQGVLQDCEPHYSGEHPSRLHRQGRDATPDCRTGGFQSMLPEPEQRR